VLVLVLVRTPDAGATVTFNGSEGGLAASASFTISGTTLTVLLTNTDTSLPGNPAPTDAALTGVFFNLGGAALTPLSATLAPGADIIQQSQCDVSCAGVTDVGGEWGYRHYPDASPSAADGITGVNQGIASSGYIGGAETLFGGANLDGPDAPNGEQFAIVPASFTDGMGNGAMDKGALIRNAVEFVLTIPEGLSESAISTVYFTYGTSFGEATLTTTTTTSSGGVQNGAIPEPASIALLGGGLAMLAYRLRRKR
jgi:hypothetical protein